ncbi:MULTISPECIES: phosphatidylserine decarboxylase family protein [Desulfosporosinus]|uniref:Phosphatidylserine decarboxylase proenzyme n=1 Tax=Desulfosporosinus nitroreducens TaxID=2018668 RepID=A0ABT8QJL4_9FIRM|nr:MULTISPECIES: phosphatidylserine decarboxylase family protein [Desulfosporosinus]MCO1600410.1 phosphatidylserine decarboxylase family protein [Desulfosporosinus nitroreducens]MDA8220325.1 phosphatidylserine decarboxylase family protein [Desulfitobacterium hafniense]MDO0821498.1 phosphatidylserine decarboxylase family protein [Desulfosporosinus nitroreducens]
MKQYPISRDGWLYLAILAGLTALAYWVWPWLIILPGILFLFVLFFFRNPERQVPIDELTLVSPADGVVMDVERVYEDQFFNGESIRVRIFLSVFNVHVNRSPMAGEVVFRAYRPGKMIPAFKSHASELNEKNFVGIENSHLKILVTQVTGFIARRIVCWVDKGDVMTKGERFGLIKFGSCTEIFVPTNVEIMVKQGDKVRGGLTIVGKVSVE